MALVHGTPETPWRAPAPEASDAELDSVYRALGQPVAIHTHIHRPYVRKLSELIVANTGSVGLSYDGDRRAAYLLDGNAPAIRRVEYDVATEIRTLSACDPPCRLGSELSRYRLLSHADRCRGAADSPPSLSLGALAAGPPSVRRTKD